MKWREELTQEIRLHRQYGVEPLAIVLQALGAEIDHSSAAKYRYTSRHYYDVHEPEQTLPNSHTCNECARLERMQRYLVCILNEIVEPFGLCASYGTMRTMLARGERLAGSVYEPWVGARLRARWRTSDILEGLLVAMWVVRRYYALTHRPGGLTDGWSVYFQDAAQRSCREASFAEAWKGGYNE